MGFSLRLPETDFAREFVVDERPEPLSLLGAGDGMGGDPTQTDLMSLVASVMRENEKLASLARQLEATRALGSDKETLRVIRSLLPVLDSFDRVCEMARDFETSEILANWLRSVEAVQARLLQTLERQGLESLDPLGERVDLDRDEVVDVRHTLDHPSDTVVEVRRRGYRFQGKMIRDAQVVVAQK